MLKVAIPLIHVTESAAARSFYCEQLGFHHEFSHRPDGVSSDPCYMGVSRDGVRLHLSSFSGDGVAGGVANLIVEGVDSLPAEFVARGVQLHVEPMDQTWGSREMYVKNSGGNCLRFMQP